MCHCHLSPCRLLLALIIAISAPACAHRSGADVGPEGSHGGLLDTVALDLQRMPSLADIVPRLKQARVVLVGEQHNRLEHHEVQLAIIQALHAADADLAIGLEFFQQPFQRHLDDYVAGRIDEPTMLRRTQYFDRWRWDYRLYAPILRFARSEGIPLVALNVPKETTDAVSAQGLEAVDPELRASLPGDIDTSDPVYRARLRKVFEQHPGRVDELAFERFVQVQAVWDEGMAAHAADYLNAHPGRRLVVLAGNGHLVAPNSIPQRLAQRLNAPQAVVLNGWTEAWRTDTADFVLLPSRRELPPPARLGVFLQTDDESGVLVERFDDQSVAREAGVRQGDRIVAIDGRPVEAVADIRLALWDKASGDQVRLGLQRDRLLRSAEEVELELTFP